MIAETRSFAVGRFTIWQRPRMDNPAFAQYLIYLVDRLIGKSFSMPDESQCAHMARHGSGAEEGGVRYEARILKPRELRGICKERASARRSREPTG